MDGAVDDGGWTREARPLPDARSEIASTGLLPARAASILRYGAGGEDHWRSAGARSGSAAPGDGRGSGPASLQDRNHGAVDGGFDRAPATVDAAAGDLRRRGAAARRGGNLRHHFLLRRTALARDGDSDGAGREPPPPVWPSTRTEPLHNAPAHLHRT